MKVAFEAVIKEIKNKSLVSGDKSTRVILEFDSNDKNKTLNDLNILQRGDRSIMVVLMDEIK